MRRPTTHFVESLARDKLGAELREEIAAAYEILNLLWLFVPGAINRDDRVEIVLAMASLALEHISSVIVLVETGNNNGSALALARPVVEAVLRAVWLCVVADEQDLHRARTGHDKAYRGLAVMAKSVDAALSGPGIFEHMTNGSGGLHGLTHGGLEQIGARFDKDGNVTANYSTKQMRMAVRSCVTAGVVMMETLCKLGLEPNAQQVRAAALQESTSRVLSRLPRLS